MLRQTALLATAALTIGGGLAVAAPATAAPGDLTMPDANLRACINASLGQGPTDAITETQAAAITVVDCQNGGIADLTGLEHMPQLETLWLNNNPDIASLAPVMNLTELESLGMGGTGVTDADLPGLVASTHLTHLILWDNDLTDISALESATSLKQLFLNNAQITDLTPLAALTALEDLAVSGNEVSDISPLDDLVNLKYLKLDHNSVTDASPLVGLTNLERLDLKNQRPNLPTVPLDAATDNPVTDVGGATVAVTSTDAGFSYDSAADTWSFSTRGTKWVSWNTPVSIGTAADVEFSGRIRQRISFAQAVPENPTVTPAVCTNGDVVYPQITLPDTEGITYSIIGDVAPGETITIEAVPADDDHAIYVDPASDWVDASGDHIYATLEITLDDPDCDEVVPTPTVIDPPNGDLPVDDPCGADNASWMLPTGDDVSEGFTWKVGDDGLLIAEANDGYQFGDGGGDLDPTTREYGYAPDSGELCPVTPAAPETPDELAATGGTLPMIGGTTAAALLGGGILLLTRRKTKPSTRG